MVVLQHFGGTMAADQTFRLILPCSARLESVSSTASNAASTTIQVGTIADPDGYLTSHAVGQSGAAVVKDAGDFDGVLRTAAMGELPVLAKGSVLLVSVDYDGAAGTAGANVSITLSFFEG
jgi:hypothetical protein